MASGVRSPFPSRAGDECAGKSRADSAGSDSARCSFIGFARRCCIADINDRAELRLPESNFVAAHFASARISTHVAVGHAARGLGRTGDGGSNESARLVAIGRKRECGVPTARQPGAVRRTWTGSASALVVAARHTDSSHADDRLADRFSRDAARNWLRANVWRRADRRAGWHAA